MKLVHAGSEIATRGWAEASATLTSLADWADLLVTGQVYHEVAANVAEYYDIPLAPLDYFPLRVNSQLVPGLPSPLIRSVMTAVWWAYWSMTKQADDAQRAELGLPKTTGLELISTACAQLDERALICSGGSDFRHIPHVDHVKIVSGVNHAAIFPTCRAVVHKGGAGTTAAGIRAGIPALILWMGADQPIWAAQIKRLKVGSARRFSSTTRESLVADLRAILTPHHLTQAREVATQMTKPSASVTTAADLVEDRLHP
jgi:UDP:flavonoid glycosyltransferase YjiC (YdhE family)